MQSKPWLGACVAVASVAILAGQEPRPTFDVASVRKTVQPNPIAPAATAPDTFYRVGEVLPYFIRLAYNVQAFQLVGGPEWLRTERFEIRAKAAGPASPVQMRLMLQTLLEDRFKLVLRRDRKSMSYLALVVERESLGPDLRPCSDWQNPEPFNASFTVPRGASFFRNRCVELSEVAARATAVMRTPVIDRTGLTGLWNYAVAYVRPQPAAVSDAVAVDAPFFDTAIRRQLGLKLQSERGPVEVLVIEHVAPPSDN